MILYTWGENNMKMPIEKLKAMLKYFCENTDPKFLGKTKLMKLFYFADFWYVKRFGHPITYDDYYKLEHGPIPSMILNLINSVEDDYEKAILADTIYIERPENFPMQRIKCLEEFSKEDKKYFTENELNVLHEVCKKFGDKDTRFIEKASHKESPWKNSIEADRIPYSLAADDHDCQVEKKDIELFEKINSY